MSKHKKRVQFRRKRATANSEKTGYGSALMDIYRRATQGGSEAYLTANQASEPERITKIQDEAQKRRERRGSKDRILRPRSHHALTSQSPAPSQYIKLQSGQVVGHPRPMCEVKQEARRTRLERRAVFRYQRADQ